MLFRQLFDRESCTYSYLIASGFEREGIIIDPVKTNLSCYLKLINELSLKLVAAIDTHLHADHITASGALSKNTACTTMMGDQTKATLVQYKFKDDETLSFDGIILKALHTPGHTPDSYCFLYENKLLTGDTLLIRGTGRTDFQDGDPYAQYHSLFDKILRLPEDTLVYPGHDYNGQTVSTLREEKNFNPRLQVSSCEEYMDIMNKLNLPPPKRLLEAVPANLCCGLD